MNKPTSIGVTCLHIQALQRLMDELNCATQGIEQSKPAAETTKPSLWHIVKHEVVNIADN